MTDPSPARRPKQPMDTSHRVYAAAFAVVVFCVSWATVAAKPWATAKPDPRLAALARVSSASAWMRGASQRVVDRRHAAYRDRPQGARSADRGSPCPLTAGGARCGGASSCPRRQPPAADHYPDVMMLRRTLRAMGTDVEFLLDASPRRRTRSDALDRAEAELERLEQVMSRFRTDSELSALNRAGRLEAAAPTSSASWSSRSLPAREAAASSIPPSTTPSWQRATTAISSSCRPIGALRQWRRATDTRCAGRSSWTETRSRSGRGQARPRRDR